MTEPAYTLKQLARAPNVVRAAVIENERRIADLEAENARLQARVDAISVNGASVWRFAQKTDWELGGLYVKVHTAERERDGYKALAERRGEALEAIIEASDPEWVMLDTVRAALAARID